MGEAQTVGFQQYEPETFEIRIQGHLHKRRSELFEGLLVTKEPDGTTTICGPLPDQTALHGILLKIRNMNLKLISIKPIACDVSDTQTKNFVSKFPLFIEEAFTRGKINIWDELFHPEYIEYIEVNGIVQGRPMCKETLKRMQSFYGSRQTTIDEIIAQGETVVVRVTSEEICDDRLVGTSQAEKNEKLCGCAIYHLKDGKAFEAFIFGNWLGLFQWENLTPTIGEGVD